MEIVCFYLPFPFGGRVFYWHNCAPLNLICWGFFSICTPSVHIEKGGILSAHSLLWHTSAGTG